MLRKRIWRLGLCVVGAVLISASAQADDLDQGQLLYDFACDACHDRSVHRRASRKAKTFGELREFVRRWSGEMGTQWSDQEIDEVARYLNDKYYHFPCPAETCEMKFFMAR